MDRDHPHVLRAGTVVKICGIPLKLRDEVKVTGLFLDANFPQGGHLDDHAINAKVEEIDGPEKVAQETKP